MIAELGRFLIALALTATLAQIVLAWLGANRGGQGGLLSPWTRSSSSMDS